MSFFKGCYIGLRTNFTKNLSPWYSIKVGKGCGVKGALGRCNDQALPALFLFDGWWVGWKEPNPTRQCMFNIIGREIVNLEHALLFSADRQFGKAPLDYSFAGSTETFGNFNTPDQAYYAAKILADEISKKDIKSEFTERPLKVVDYFEQCRQAQR